MPDRGSLVAVWHPLAAYLSVQIAARELSVAEHIFSGLEISHKTGIFRMAVREAIVSLVCESVLEVKPGIGTSVAEPRIGYDMARLFGFSEELARLGRRASYSVLSRGSVQLRGVSAGGWQVT